MSRRAAAVFLAVALAVAVAVGLWWWRAARERAGRARADVPGAPAGTETRTVANLYFPGEGGLLYAERREIVSAPGAAERARAVVAALLAGPQGAGLQPPFPGGVEVGSVAVVGDVAFVDLRAPEQPEPPAGGSLREMLMVYSVVDSVLLNVPEVKRVALLWNGVQRESFSGHLDTTRPLAADTSLVARS
ncbi:MAG TPA: GerMN domain-containing protein [Thermoanaerobaculia bacterium]|nr:GerMN domain-containing protein [Thermoanaerobaculia bacterium]